MKIAASFLATLVFSSFAIAEDIYQSKFEECMKTLKPLERLYISAGSDLAEDCRKRAKSEAAWANEGSPTLLLARDYCTFAGVQSPEVKSCLSAIAQSAPSAILLKASPNIHAEVVMEVINFLKGQGINNIMFSTEP